MKTLIELYDERPVENVLATELFHSEETIFICPGSVAQNQALRRALNDYFALRGCDVKLSFVPVSLENAKSVKKELKRILETHEDCVIDISGGTDAALYAAGSVAGDTPVITYSHKKNTFYEIQNAPFADALPCTICLTVEACFLMAGGTLLPGRGDSRQLALMLPEIERVFSVYGSNRRIWNRQISYFQRLTPSEGFLSVKGPRTLKADNRKVTVDEGLLHALHGAGFISHLKLKGNEVSFRYTNETTMFWLRDMGAALELHVFRACHLAGCFDDIILSAVVAWNEGESLRDSVSNEIDVVAVQGVHPLFISCKTCEIRTEALNELAILRDRFGGKGSRAMIVTSTGNTQNRKPMLRRAAELEIEVVEWEDLRLERLIARLKGKGRGAVTPTAPIS